MRGLLVFLLVLAGLLVVADRVAVAVAEDQVGNRIAEAGQLPGAPEVDITGFPFLTQAVAGEYDEVLLEVTAADLGEPEGTSAVVSLRGVEVPLSDVLSGSVQQIPVQRIDGRAVLSYSLLAAEIGAGTELERDGDGLRITRTVDVVGQEMELTASGTATLDDGDLVIDVEEAAGGGIDLPEQAVRTVSDLLGLRYPLPQLPYGLELSDARPADGGVVVRARADGAVIGADPE